MRRVVRGLRLSQQQAERSVGLSAAQLFVLQSVGRGMGLSLREVAAITATDPSSVSVVVTRLVTAGLVRRRRSARDGRRLELTLTTRGRQVLAEAPEFVAQQDLVAAVGALSSAERRTLGRLLRRVADAMAGAHTPEMFFEDRANGGGPTRRKT